MDSKNLEDFAQLISEGGYFAKKRTSGLGNSVMVGHKSKDKLKNGIEVVKRGFHVAQREDGSWYTMVGGADINEKLTFDELINYTLRVLALSEKEYLAELDKTLIKVNK